MSHIGEGIASDAREKIRCTSAFEAGIWVALWLLCLAGMLVYLYISEELTAEIWLAFLLLALFSPSVSAFKKALGHETDANGPGAFKGGL